MSKNIFVEFIEKYQKNPVGFVQDILQQEPDPWQKDLLEAVLKHRLLAVKSGHGIGKSCCCSWLMLHHMLCFYPQKTVCTAPTSAQLFDALFAELKSQVLRLPPALKNLFDVFSERITLKSDPSGSFISCRTARKETPEALQGIHSEHVLLICDEASSVDSSIFEASGGSLSTPNSKLLMVGNPTRSEGYFYDAFTKLQDRWWTKTVSCEDSPRVSKNYIEEMEERYSRDSAVFAIRVLGEFAETSDDTIISNALVESAVTRDVEPTKGPITWGVDVARFGADKSALCKRQGNTVLEHIKSWAKIDTMNLMGALNAEYQKSKQENLAPDEILVDVIGIGASIVDRGRELNMPVVGINTGESASLSGQYKNLRCELWHKAKEWFEQRHCRIPRDERLMFELCSPRYSFESSGKIRMETKEEMKKRLGHKGSPDFADSFVLTFAGQAGIITGAGGSWGKPLKRNISGIV